MNISKLDSLFREQQNAIEEWLQQELEKAPSLLYCSVDLRNADFKIAPIDTNLFPAGFNNIAASSISVSSEALQILLNNLNPNTKHIGLIPESHTRNPYYLMNLLRLQEIITGAGFNLRIMSLHPEITQQTFFNLENGKQLEVWPLENQDGQLHSKEFIPDILILNNDLSTGLPEILQNVKQPILPSVYMGWGHRMKSVYFTHYQIVAHQFATDFNFDPWLIMPLFANCGHVDFPTKKGEDCLLRHSTELFEKIQVKYDEYGIKQEPFVFIKTETGTYGIGVMVVHKLSDIVDINRKQRNRMSIGKSRQKITKVILQEGIPTVETHGHNAASAEPVMYLIGQQAIGGFYRAHEKRNTKQNLNSPGMSFTPCELTVLQQHYTYTVISRLAMLAAARESLSNKDIVMPIIK